MADTANSSANPPAPGDDLIVNTQSASATNVASRSGSGAGRKPALRAKAGEAAKTVRGEALTLKDQATGKAREAARKGKDQATGSLDEVARAIDDVALQIDNKVGVQYGDYARQASKTVTGFADGLRNKDVDELVRDAGAFVRKSPAIAIGAAAAVGFVLARLIKAGGAPEDRT